MVNKKVLVTGGLGYIGSHTVVELLNAGFKVTILDNLSNSELAVLDNIEKICHDRPVFFEVDISDMAAMKSALEGKYFSGIIHFAAKKSVGESVEKPILYFRNNIDGTINLLDLMTTGLSTNLVFSSSCTVYGQPAQLPVSESSPILPAESPYGSSKQMCERILSDAVPAHERLNAISLRYFNPVGAHHSSLIGEYPKGKPDNLVPFITQTAAGWREKLSVFGNDYNTADGTAIRDYIHVVDLATAHIKALERQLKGVHVKPYEFFNLGSGRGYSVLEIIKTFEEVNKVKLNYQITDRRSGDIEKIYADTHLAEKELNWKARLNLEDMMSSAWNWQKTLLTPKS